SRRSPHARAAVACREHRRTSGARSSAATGTGDAKPGKERRFQVNRPALPSDGILVVAVSTQVPVREATHLAPLPQPALRLIAIVAREGWTPEEVLEVVQLDPVLTGKVLGLANSALAGGVRRILALDEAIHRVGARAVAGLAVACGVKGRLSAALPQFDLAEGELWRHSVAALLGAELVGPFFRVPYSTAAVTAALVHDVGK